MIYLDHNSTNLVDPRVRAAYERALDEAWANPSSPHAPGRHAKKLLEVAREQVAALAGVSPGQVTFTGSGSEALNQALRSALPPGARALASAVEHPAVLRALEALAAERGVAVELAPVDGQGRLDLAAWEARLDPTPSLACLQSAQNEVGTLQPVAEAGAAAQARGAPLLLDASQALGRVAWVWPDLPWDYLVISGHKLRAPRGAAALVHRGRAPEPLPLILGGSQERGRRAGTEPVAPIVALGEACRLVAAGTLLDAAALEAERAWFEAALLAAIPRARVLGSDAPRLPNTTLLCVPGARTEALLARLDLAGVSASAGSACSSGALERSHVLEAMGVPPELAQGRVRFSLGPETSRADLARAVEVLAAAAADAGA
ncbi:MAG: cysteine desulfurase family protein [Planctomycetota bacterium]